MRRKHTALFAFCLLAGMIAVCGLWLRAQQQQYTLNRQLLAALVKGNDTQALVLVNAGADPNTHYKSTPVPSLPEFVNQLLHRSTPNGNDSPTALLMACGCPWNAERETARVQSSRLDASRLVQTMLSHGAQVNAKNTDGATSLLCAVREQRCNTVKVLLDHGADVNARIYHRRTPLMYAMFSPCVMRLLLEHGAEVNAQDDRGCTALYWVLQVLLSPMLTVPPQPPYDPTVAKQCIGQLIAHGANPRCATLFGLTPLRFAQLHRCPDLVALLQAGAKK